MKVLYNNQTKFIEEIANKFRGKAIIELYNYDKSKKRSSIRKMQENFGSKNYPLVIFENENLEEVFALWSESQPNWEEDIQWVLNDRSL